MDLFYRALGAYTGYAQYLWGEITWQSSPWWKNYFWWLILVSLFFFALEVWRPWRAEQPRFRRDFWLDAFYMFFNFFLFSLIIYNAASQVVVDLLHGAISYLSGIELGKLNPMATWPLWAVLLTGFIVRDFVQWNVHRLLHRYEFLWKYHKVHHSVQEMGFAAHLRYHWMETIVYRSIEYLPLALLGVGLHEFFIIHIFALAIGHYNHANFYLEPKVKGYVFGTVIAAFVVWVGLGLEGIWPWLGLALGAFIGRLVYPIWGIVFNSPEMHIWHHVHSLPEGQADTERFRYGLNFGISLALWDYLFGYNYIPHDGRDIALGFPGVENYPESFLEQNKP